MAILGDHSSKLHSFSEPTISNVQTLLNSQCGLLLNWITKHLPSFHSLCNMQDKCYLNQQLRSFEIIRFLPAMLCCKCALKLEQKQHPRSEGQVTIVRNTCIYICIVAIVSFSENVVSKLSPTESPLAHIRISVDRNQSEFFRVLPIRCRLI